MNELDFNFQVRFELVILKFLHCHCKFFPKSGKTMPSRPPVHFHGSDSPDTYTGLIKGKCGMNHLRLPAISFVICTPPCLCVILTYYLESRLRSLYNMRRCSHIYVRTYNDNGVLMPKPNKRSIS